MADPTTITLSQSVKKRLDEFGGPGDSYEDVIEELLETAEQRRRP